MRGRDAHEIPPGHGQLRDPQVSRRSRHAVDPIVTPNVILVRDLHLVRIIAAKAHEDDVGLEGEELLESREALI